MTYLYSTLYHVSLFWFTFTANYFVNYSYEGYIYLEINDAQHVAVNPKKKGTGW